MVALLQPLRRAVERHPTLQQILLGCGIAGSAWWVAMDTVGSIRYPGYSYADQVVSELSAEGAPTRTFMQVFSGIPYAALLTAFGIGIWRAAGESRAGHVTGALVIAEAVWGLVGGIAFPMATREVMAASQDTLRNQMHQWYGIGMPILFALAVGFGSRLLGKRFRYYSYATILVILVAGFMMSQQNSALAANEPTRWMGLNERVVGYLPMIWYAVLAVGLLRAEGARSAARSEHRAATPREMQQLPR